MSCASNLNFDFLHCSKCMKINLHKRGIFYTYVHYKDHITFKVKKTKLKIVNIEIV